MLKNFSRDSSRTEDSWILSHRHTWFIYSSHQWDFTDRRPWLWAGGHREQCALTCGQSLLSAGICKPQMSGRPPIDLLQHLLLPQGHS